MTVGIIGVGHLAVSLIEGLLTSGMPPDSLVLSPRGRARTVAAKHGIPLAADNYAVVESSEVVILAVRPDAVEAAISGLPWREGQALASACAGVRLQRLSSLVRGPEIARIMPLTAARFCASPTLLFPDSARLWPVLSRLGPVVPVKEERQFEIGAVNAAIYGWAQALIRTAADWSHAQGMDAETARRLSALTFMAAGRMTDENDASMSDLLEQIATPGGITQAGLTHLEAAAVPAAWEQACDIVLKRLLSGS